jgi:hypothetical protein
VILEYMGRSSSNATMGENLVPNSEVPNNWKHRKVDRVWAKVGAILCASVNAKMFMKLNLQEARARLEERQNKDSLQLHVVFKFVDWKRSAWKSKRRL